MASDSDWINGRPRSSLALNDHDWDQFMKRVFLEGYIEVCDNYMVNLGKEEALSNLRQSAVNSGIAFAANARLIFGDRGKDVAAISEILHIFQAAAGVGPPEREDVRLDSCEWAGPTKCPYLSGSSGTCRWGEMIMDEITKAINPEYTLRIPSMTHEGGRECRYILERRDKVKTDGQS
jgi:hypothetical protein